MQKYLYILCEGEKDEIFYERLAEKVTGQSFQTDCEYRVRKGSNSASVLSASRLLFKERFKHWQGTQDVAVIIAVDNDRAPEHPGGKIYPRSLAKTDVKKQPRYSALKQLLNSELGPDRHAWPIDVALAVPVEMIESWLLILLDPWRDELPPFSEAASGLARLYYVNTPPPQLKDLRDQEARTRSMSLDDLFWHAAEQDIEPAAQRCPSLRMFLEDLRQWRRE